MIYEYALEPEMVANWGSHQDYRFYIRQFGLGECRVVSRYPKKWAKMVYEAFGDGDPNDKMRLVELLVRIQEIMVKRTDCKWDNDINWFSNILTEHKRYPFHAILVKNSVDKLSEIICESDLNTPNCKKWDLPHSIIAGRNATEMTAAITPMFLCCKWVKFVDSYFSIKPMDFTPSYLEYFKILASKRPTGPISTVEIHTSNAGATSSYLKTYCEKIIPSNLKVSLYRWKERPSGQRLHNRYILTNHGGVAFLHGTDIGEGKQTDDLILLDREPYELHCQQYKNESISFDLAEPPIDIVGRL